MTKINTCRICNNSKGNKQYVLTEMHYGLRDKFIYFECNECHCLQIQEFPKDMSKHYPDYYYSFENYDGKKWKGIIGKIKRKQYLTLITGGKVLQKIVKLLTGNTNYYILQGLGVNKNTRILDVGCGNGSYFLYPLAEIGFENLLGCDPYLKSPLTYSNGLHIKNSKVYDVKGSWDIITYHHSFEHVEDPIENLRKVAELLASNGVCILRVPTVSSFAWEHYRTNWVQLDAPRHFFLHSKKSMQTLAEITNLELFKTVYDSTHFQFSGSQKYLNNVSLNTPESKGLIKFIQRKVKKSQYKMRAKQLNTKGKGDQASFYFRKRNDSQNSANKK